MPPIDWSNPTVQGVLIAGLFSVVTGIIGAGVGFLGARVGAKVGADAARAVAEMAKAEAQADRESAERARREERADARAARFAERKLALSVDLLQAADLHRREADAQVGAKWGNWSVEMEYDIEVNDPVPSVGPTEPVWDSCLALDVVAPAVSADARQLYEATVPLGALAARWPDPRSPEGTTWNKQWDEATTAWDLARHRFVSAVRADLGVNPEPSQAGW